MFLLDVVKTKQQLNHSNLVTSCSHDHVTSLLGNWLVAFPQQPSDDQWEVRWGTNRVWAWTAWTSLHPPRRFCPPADAWPDPSYRRPQTRPSLQHTHTHTEWVQIHLCVTVLWTEAGVQITVDEAEDDHDLVQNPLQLLLRGLLVSSPQFRVHVLRWGDQSRSEGQWGRDSDLYSSGTHSTDQ